MFLWLLEELQKDNYNLELDKFLPSIEQTTFKSCYENHWFINTNSDCLPTLKCGASLLKKTGVLIRPVTTKKKYYFF